MNSIELTGAVTTLANAISCNMTVSELNLLAAVLTQLGDTIATIATQRSFCEELNEGSKDEE